MGFLAPFSFWFLSTIPIILLFYFLKKQYENQPISSIYLWQRTLNQWETDKWWTKLQKNLLLLLQLLFLLFLMIALTRPYFTGQEVVGDHLVIVIDSSASMTAIENEQSRFDTTKEQAQQLIGRLSNDHKVSIIDAQQTPILVASNLTNHAEVSRTLSNREISYQHQNLDASIALAQSLLAQESGEIHVFTDHYPKQKLENLASGDDPITVHNRELTVENRAIKTFGIKLTGDKVTAMITVKNEAATEKQVVISLLGEGEQLEQLTETIGPNTETTITVSDLPVFNYYQAQLDADSYPLDNTAVALLPSTQASSVYLAGEISPFVEQALRAAGIDTTYVPKDEAGEYHFSENQQAIYLLSNIAADNWPLAPKLVLSPTQGGPFEIAEKVDLEFGLSATNQDPILGYTEISQVYLNKAYAVGNWNGLEPLVKSKDQVVIAKGSYQGEPIVMIPFDIADSDWPLHVDFPIFLANSLNYLAQQGHTLGYFLSMENMNLHFSPNVEEAVIEAINGDDVKAIDMSQSSVTLPAQPGIYQLHEKTNSGSSIRYFVVQLHSEERTAANAESYTWKSGEQQGNDVKLSTIELWQLFAIIALVLLFVEWEVYRRGLTSR